MKSIWLLFLLGTLSSVANAQTLECQSISKASDRQACNDRAPPAWVAEHDRQPGSRIPDQPDQAASGSNTPTPLADVLAAERAKLNAATKSICRGC